MDNETTNQSNVKTIYGTIVIVTQGEKVLLSRRLETPMYSKKWQLINGRMHGGNEASSDTAVRVLERETGIQLPKEELIFMGSLTLSEIHQFYYIYAVNIPIATPLSDDSKKQTKHRSDWRFFNLNNAVVLDVAPGIRSILIKLASGLNKVKRGIEPQELDKKKTQPIPVFRIPVQEVYTVQGCCMDC